MTFSMVLIGALALSNLVTLVALRRARAQARKHRLALILNQLGTETEPLAPDAAELVRNLAGGKPPDF